MDEVKAEKELHLRKAEAALKAKNDSREKAKKDDSVVSIVFDLQKTLPTPTLTCTKVFYARQLWTYNLCVHNLGTGNANMYMWDESRASRGCQEITSCLLKFLETLPPNVKHIEAFSDNCGGQNKSHITVKFWLWVVNNTQIETVNHKYLMSGHSFNECDQDFGIIEKAKQKNEKEIFIPQHWEQAVSKSSRKFTVVRMEEEDFKTVEPLKRFITKTVKDIRSMQWMLFKKGEPTKLFYKTSVNDIFHFEELELRPKCLGKHVQIKLPLALSQNPVQPKIKLKKYRDLLDLLCFIPPIHHPFYVNLPHEEQNHIVEQGVQRQQIDYDNEPCRVFETDSESEG